MLNRIFKNFEWRLSLRTVIWSLLVPVGSFILPAWAAKAAGMFSEYAPFSWVLIGFGGVILCALCVALYGFGISRVVKSRYDANFMQETGGVDPLAKVFEGKRIYLHDFVLPSNPNVHDKTFVDCEIVGPANIYFHAGNTVDDVKPGIVDAVTLSGLKFFNNGIWFHNCKFRSCTFHRVTIFFEPHGAIANHELNWLNWISPMPEKSSIPEKQKPNLIENQSPEEPTATEEEKLP